jgi:hypothetical protein
MQLDSFNSIEFLWALRQIAEFVCLFPADYISEYIQPVTFILALDKVAEVRSTAVKAVS